MEREMERMDLRLQLRKQQAEAGDIVLLCGERTPDPLAKPRISA
jgi:hypothetical protein